MKTLCFVVDKSLVDVDLELNRIKFEAMQYVNWSDMTNLSRTLRAQAIVNILNLESIYYACMRGDPIYLMENITDPVPDKTNVSKYIYHYSDVSDATRAKFLEISSIAKEVITRDQLALNQIGFNVNIHAVVLLDDNDYYLGHIYAWCSPTKPNICFAMGIRSRIDSIFLKTKGMMTIKVAPYLIEGVFSLAQKLGCDTVVVPSPFDNMVPILLSFGFKPTEEYTDEDVGRSIAIKNPCKKGVNGCFHRNITKFKPSLDTDFIYVPRKSTRSYLYMSSPF